MATIHEISRNKFKIKEIPIVFKDREKGYSKIPKAEILTLLFSLPNIFKDPFCIKIFEFSEF